MKKNKQGNGNEKTEKIRQTADVVAVSRFRETEKKVPLVFDPFAGLFVSPEGEKMLSEAIQRWPFFSEYLMVRARFIDCYLENVCIDEDIRQIVILGAGNDMRSMRLPFLKHKKVYEIDLPKQIEKKRQLLTNKGILPENVIYIGKDISTAHLVDILSNSGFICQEKSVFVLEGLIYYLNPKAVDNIFRQIKEISCPGSFLLLDQITSDMTSKSKETKTDPYPHRPSEYLADMGFSIIENVSLGELTKRYLGKSNRERWWALACKK